MDNELAELDVTEEEFDAMMGTGIPVTLVYDKKDISPHRFRRFYLRRKIDTPGVSGIGIVAHGTEFPDGTTVVRWKDKGGFTSMWSSVEELMRIHGHEDKTTLQWIDDDDEYYC